MDICNIKSEGLRELTSSTKHNSMTIESDMEDALTNSNNDAEFVQNWRSALHALIKECQGVLLDLKDY